MLLFMSYFQSHIFWSYSRHFPSFAIPDHPWLQNAKKAPDVNLGETVRARLQQFSVMNKFKKKALRVRFDLLHHVNAILAFNL